VQGGEDRLGGVETIVMDRGQLQGGEGGWVGIDLPYFLSLQYSLECIVDGLVGEVEGLLGGGGEQGGELGTIRVGWGWGEGWKWNK
jgi:hypothetical protein